MLVRVLFSLKHFLRYPPPTSDLSVFHILMSMVFDQERCMEWYIFTQFKRRLRRYKVQRHSSICFQRGFLRNAYATKTLVGTFLRVLWMFLYEDNFASLPTMYFRYPVSFRQIKQNISLRIALNSLN